MKRTALSLSIAALAVLILAGCQGAEEPPGPLELSVADLRGIDSIELVPVFGRINAALAALPTDELGEVLSRMIDDTETLYAEENAAYEALWVLEVEYGTPEPVDLIARRTYTFRWFPRWAPGTGGGIQSFNADFDSVEEIREIRASRILRMREARDQFDLTRAGRAISLDFRVALNHIREAEERLGRARAEIEFDETGVRPLQ